MEQIREYAKRTLLHAAVVHKRFEIVRYLYGIGARLDTLDFHNEIPLESVFRFECPEIARFLALLGAPGNSQTIIRVASRYWVLPIFELALEVALHNNPTFGYIVRQGRFKCIGTLMAIDIKIPNFDLKRLRPQYKEEVEQLTTLESIVGIRSRIYFRTSLTERLFRAIPYSPLKSLNARLFNH